MPTPYSTEILIRESHLDSFGHVNNAAYLVILEDVRWEWLGRGGITFESIHRDQLGPTILEIQIAFKREIRLRERVRVECQLGSLSGKVFEIQQKIFNQAGELCTEALLKCALFDMRARRIVALNETWQRCMA